MCVDIKFRHSVFFVMLRHGTMPNEGIVAPGSHAVKVFVCFVVVTMSSAAVHISIEEFKTFQDCDVVVKVLGV